MIGNRITGLISQGAYSLSSSLWDYVKPDLANKLLLLRCDRHNDKPAQFLNTKAASDSSAEYFLCAECGMNSERAGSGSSPTASLVQIEQVLDYFNTEYAKFKRKGTTTGLPTTRFQEFLSGKDVIQKQVHKTLTETHERIALRFETIRAECNKMIDEHKAALLGIYNREIKQFESNTAYVTSKLDSFVKEVKECTVLPDINELSNELRRTKTEENVSQFMKSRISHLDTLTKKFEWKSKDGLYKKERMASALLKALLQQTHKIPKPSEDLAFASQIPLSPLECLSSYLDVCRRGTEELTPFRMLSSFDNIENLAASSIQFLSSDNITEDSTDAQDYFYTTTPADLRCLHYFDNLHRKLLVVKLENIQKMSVLSSGIEDLNRGVTYEELDLPNDSKLAALVKTIVTPKGNIFFVGGLNSNKTLELTPKQPSLTLHQKADMSCEKYGMGLVYVEPGIIYSIGGMQYRDSRLLPTGHCERYFIAENHWEQVASLNLPASQPGVSLFRNRYLYKFGGYITDDGRPNNLIEEFDLHTGKWKELRIMDYNGVNMLPRNIAWQLNDKQVVVLGGNRRFLPTGAAFALNLHERWGRGADVDQEDFSDLIQPLKDLPLLEGFEVASHALDNQKLYAFVVFQQLDRLEKKFLVFNNDFFQRK